MTEPWLGHRDNCPSQWHEPCDCEVDWSTCHCGEPADGHLPGYCALCCSVRCDAYPGACTGSDLTEEHR